MTAPSEPTLIVVTGATASGKTALAIDLAEHFGAEIISADSRQIYRGIPIVTAAPTPEELERVRHHFIATLPLDAYFSAAEFEQQSLALLDGLWRRSPVQVVCGGSMMYVDALLRGIDELPTIDDDVRRRATAIFTEGGIEALRHELQRLDPDYYATADLANHKRLIHAIEITMQAGQPYSRLRSGEVKKRGFRAVKVALDIERPQLFDRINRRVDRMIADGLEEEARSVVHLRHLNSLNTVGLKEMFAMFDGEMDRPTAIARIGKNTRVYAKKQLTWLKRRPDETIWLKPENAFNDIKRIIESQP